MTRTPNDRHGPDRLAHVGPWPAEARPWLPDVVAPKRWPLRWTLAVGCLVAAVVLLLPVLR